MHIFEKSLQSDGHLIIKGRATSNDLDYQGEMVTITPKALERALPAFYAKGAPIYVDHGKNPKYQNRQVGKVILMDYNPKTWDLDNPFPEEMSITSVCIIWDPEAISDILSGLLDSHSIRLLAYNKMVIPDTPHEILTDIELDELTLTANPANPTCTFDIVSTNDFPYQVGQKVSALRHAAHVSKTFMGSDGIRRYELEFAEAKIKTAIVKEDDIALMADDQQKTEAVEDEGIYKGCVMAEHDKQMLLPLSAMVDPADLHEKGIPEMYHTTLLYGLDKTMPLHMIAKQVQPSMPKLYMEEVKVLGADVFESEEFDVLMLKVESEGIMQANEALKGLSYENSYPEYQPHVTLAYLQKGCGKKYKEMMNTVSLPASLKTIDIRYSKGDEEQPVSFKSFIEYAAGMDGAMIGSSLANQTSFIDYSRKYDNMRPKK